MSVSTKQMIDESRKHLAENWNNQPSTHIQKNPNRMEEYLIEKNVPIPVGKSGKYSTQYKRAAERMEVGDSILCTHFVVKDKTGKTISVVSAEQQGRNIVNNLRKMNRRGLKRKVSETPVQYRVWRFE